MKRIKRNPLPPRQLSDRDLAIVSGGFEAHEHKTVGTSQDQYLKVRLDEVLVSA